MRIIYTSGHARNGPAHRFLRCSPDFFLLPDIVTKRVLQDPRGCKVTKEDRLRRLIDASTPPPRSLDPHRDPRPSADGLRLGVEARRRGD